MWDMRCDECGRAYHSPVDDMRESEDSARRNGWVVGPIVQCPTCAAADTTDDDSESSEDPEHVAE